jgi:hypothetical protein
MRRLLHAVALLTLAALLAGTQCSAQCLASVCGSHHTSASPHSHGKSPSDCTHSHLQISKADRAPDLLRLMLPGIAAVPCEHRILVLLPTVRIYGNSSPPLSRYQSSFSILRI